MKSDLATTILAAAAGFIIAYLVCNFLMPELESVRLKELDSDIVYEIVEPDPNVFNYRALNPTVEVFVGNEDNSDEEQEDDIINDMPDNTLENETPLEGDTNPGEQTNGSSN